MSLEIGSIKKNEMLSLADESFCYGLSGLTSLMINNQEKFDKAQACCSTVPEILTMAIEAKDHYTHKHSVRVTSLAVALAECVGFQGQELEDLKMASLLHDVGKIGIPSEILLKRDKLTDEDRKVLRLHPTMSAEIIEYFQCVPDDIIKTVRHHHERIDGEGYPGKLKGADIPLASRILAIADSWDAMTADRPYRRALTKSEAGRELRDGKGIQFDEMLVDLFLVMISSSLSVH